MKTFFLLVFSLFTLVVFSQGRNTVRSFRSPITEGPVADKLVKNLDVLGNWIKKNDQVKGSPLLEKIKDNKLLIQTLNGETYNIPNGNFDTELNKFVYTFTKDSMYVIDDKYIKFGILNNQKIKKFGKGYDRQYYIILNEGDKVVFLKKVDSKILKSKTNPMTQKKMSDDKYILSNNYSVVINNKITPITLSKRILQYIDESNLEDVKSFIKSNKLSLKNEANVRLIFNYYNSL